MDKYFLIQPAGAEETDFGAYLSEINAVCVKYISVREAAESGTVPCGILLVADRHLSSFESDLNALRSNYQFAKIPRMIFISSGLARVVQQSGDYSSEMVFYLPLDKSTFLARLNAIKKRAQRRVLQIVLRIQPLESNLMYFGKSLDFSESGIAFECDESFIEGAKVAVSFVNPKNKKRIILPSVITRKAALTDDKFLYGARFDKASGELVQDLLEFITAPPV